MHLLLFGYFGIVLVILSALSAALQVTQKPRFYGVKASRSVMIYCVGSERTPAAPVEWYKAPRYDAETKTRVDPGDRVSARDKSPTRNASLRFQNLGTEDSGVYFCRMNQSWGPGTEIQVLRPYNVDSAEGRTRMKDILILFQVFLLVLCVAAPFLYRRTLLKKEETIYEEPEHDHIYEGLEPEQCGGSLYEDLSLYVQPAEAQAAWEQD